MKTHILEAKKRELTGRKVKKLRQKGVLPATVYGKGQEAISVEIQTEAFIHTFKQTGQTGLINLTIQQNTHPVLVKQVAIHPVSGIPLHVEFHQVNLKEKIRANVPIIFSGESQAVKEKIGTLLELIDEVEVEALPTNLPENIEVDISGLLQVDDHISVKDLVVPENVTIVTEQDIMVVKIGELLAPEPEPVKEEVGETEPQESPNEGATDKQEEGEVKQEALEGDS